MTRITLLLLITYLGFQLHASENNHTFKHITTRDGLNQSHILCMTQDSEGFMWIGTYGGLNRYNGYDMDYYLYDEQDSTSLSHNIVYCVFEDFNKNIWVGTENGLNRFHKKSDSFERIMTTSGNSENEQLFNIRAICQQDSSSLWIASYGNGLYQLNLKTNQFKHYQNIKGNSNSLISNLVNELYLDRDNELWIGTENGGLSKFNRQQNSFTNFVPEANDPNSLSNDIVSSIVQDQQGIFWVGTWHGGLNRFDPISKKFTSYPNPNKTNDFYPFSTVRDLVLDSKDNLWIATLGGGLAILDKERKEFHYETRDVDNPQSIRIDMQWSLCIDREDQIWCGSFGSGISIYNPNREKFHCFPHRKDQSFSSPIIQNIFEENDSTLWLATFNGINIFDRKKQTCIDHLLLHAKQDIKDVKKIYKDRDGKYWLGTSAGLIRLNPDMQSYQQMLMGNPVNEIYQDKKGDLWAGGWNTGLIYIPASELIKDKPDPSNFTIYTHNEKDTLSLASNIIWNIYEDSRNQLWVVNYKSTQIFDRENKIFRYPPINNLLSNFQVLEDRDKNIWMPTTTQGVLQFDPDQKTASYYSRKNDLPNNTALSLVEDNNGIIWTATNDGLSRINPETHQVINFDSYDGLPDSKFLVGSCTKLRDGMIAMGTSLGFILFDPDLIFLNPTKPTTAITDIQLFGKSITKRKIIGDNAVEIHQSVNSLDTLYLNYRQNMISIEFSALSFSRPIQNRYKYKMEGFDENWIDADHDRKATYTNLDPNEYTFRIQSSNNNGIWSDREKTLVIIITPPWWQSNWFRTLLILFVILSSVSFYYYKTSQIKKHNAELAALVAERTAELQNANGILVKRQEEILDKNRALQISENKQKELNATKDKFFGIISHDLRSPFSAIIGLSRELHESYDEFDADTQKEFIKDIYESADHTYKFLENLLIWANSQRGNIDFNTQEIQLSELVERNTRLLEQTAENKSIQISQAIAADLLVFTDRNMLSTIIRNILSNSIKFTPTNGYIHIEATRIDQDIEICIKDNGVGMTKAVQDQIFDISTNHSSPGTENEKGTGLGLLLCKEFVERLGGKIWVVSEPGVGSSFYFTIPNSNDHSANC